MVDSSQLDTPYRGPKVVGLRDWSTRLLYPEQMKPGKLTFNRKLEDFNLV
jgi:hypothetical protein